MSQQPPYGNPEQPSPYQPYGGSGQQPYSGYGVPAPYGSPPKRSHTTRNTLIIVAVVVLVLCGGGVAAVVGLADGIESDFDSEFNTDYRGNSDDPLTISEGEGFEIRGFEYAKGWTIRTTGDYGNVIEGLTVTNDRDDDAPESANLTFRFLSGNVAGADVTCYSVADTRPDESTRMTCDGDPASVPRDYSDIEVYDTATYE